MAVETFECQIAKGQINRYLSGENFSGEGIRQLEEHISTCDNCKQALAERKAALQKMLGADSPAPVAAISTETAVPVTEPLKKEVPSAEPASPSNETMKMRAAQQVLAAMKESKIAASKTETGSFTKPLIYSALLAVALLGMSYVSKTIGPRGITINPSINTQNKVAPVAKSVNLIAPTAEKAGSIIATATSSIDFEPVREETLVAGPEPSEDKVIASTPKNSEISAPQPSKPIAGPKPIRTRLSAKRLMTKKSPEIRRHAAVHPKIVRAKRARPVRITEDTVKIYDPSGKPVTDN